MNPRKYLSIKSQKKFAKSSTLFLTDGNTLSSLRKCNGYCVVKVPNPISKLELRSLRGAPVTKVL